VHLRSRTLKQRSKRGPIARAGEPRNDAVGARWNLNLNLVQLLVRGIRENLGEDLHQGVGAVHGAQCDGKVRVASRLLSL
jgi:hypothetical protein